MSLSQQLKSQLDRASNGLADSTIQTDTDCGRLGIKLAEVNKLACDFEWIRYHDDRFATLNESQLRQVGAWLEKRVNYLFEPLAVIELDNVSRTLQMRSASPTRQAGSIVYFELALSPRSGVTMRRLVKTPGSRRQCIPATVTREVLLRLCEDLISSGSCLGELKAKHNDSTTSTSIPRSSLPEIV